MAGYLGAQPGLWATQGTPSGPVEINPAYGFWSWVDRLNTSCTTASCPYYPSYNVAFKQSTRKEFCPTSTTHRSQCQMRFGRTDQNLHTTICSAAGGLMTCFDRSI